MRLKNHTFCKLLFSVICLLPHTVLGLTRVYLLHSIVGTICNRCEPCDQYRIYILGQTGFGAACVGFNRRMHTYTCFSRGRVGSTLSPTTQRPSCAIRNFTPPPASGLDLGPAGRNRSVGDEERSHSTLPSDCAAGRRGTHGRKVSHGILHGATVRRD